MGGDESASERFAAGVEAWAARLGSARDRVRQRLVGEQLAEVTSRRPGSWRVLDIGCGQGTQALELARAGHRVTGLDSSSKLLERFSATLAREPADVRERCELVTGRGEDARTAVSGAFDLVLCHGVLMYLDDPGPMLDAIAAVAAPGGVASLLVRNGLAMAMRPGLRGDWAAALAAFDSPDYTNNLGLPACGHTPDQVDAPMGQRGWRREAWFGVRVFIDHREATYEPDDADGLLAVERAASGRDPYRQVAALSHLVYAR